MEHLAHTLSFFTISLFDDVVNLYGLLCLEDDGHYFFVIGDQSPVRKGNMSGALTS